MSDSDRVEVYLDALSKLSDEVIRLRKDNKVLADTVTTLAKMLKVYEDGMPSADDIKLSADRLEHSARHGGPLGYTYVSTWLGNIASCARMPEDLIVAVNPKGVIVGGITV